MRLSWLFPAMLLAGCAHRVSAEPPKGGAEGKNLGAGTFAQPIQRCGPHDSYYYVAREFQCSDGTNPFAGQLQEAARARQGAREHPGGHFVDLYRVPCSSGDVIVYVDMYGCPEQEAEIVGGPSPGLKRAIQAFDGGDFPEAVRECMAVVDQHVSNKDMVECLAITPAAMILSGGEPQALKLVGGFCSKLPTGEHQQIRVRFVDQVVRWVFRGSKGRLSRAELSVIVGRFATACGVNDAQGA
ncbi:MAG: hypothetical protein RMJ98_13660 [Myxococcales bacterium]|nr:hypothetical protein [Polyangiaceae bacterium]MDW8250337.1 hypothetical protein [Myxococcales bacterium]